MKVLTLLMALGVAQAQSVPSITGKWQWRGRSGWQRIELNLKSSGSTFTGIMRIGPGTDEPESPEEFFEYFFDPVDFKISEGTISGNRISFEQVVTRFSGARGRGGPSLTTRFLYKGIISGDTIDMTREVVPDKKDSWSLGNQRVEFVLKRVN